jgi:hypothetical protein
MAKKTWEPSHVTFELNAWWRTQNRWQSKSQAAAELGIPKTTFIQYFYGAIPRPPHNMVLYEATGLEIVRNEPGAHQRSRTSESPVDQLDETLSQVSRTLRLLSDQLGTLHEVFEHVKSQNKSAARILPFPAKEKVDTRVKVVKQMLYGFIAALETFRSSGADRQALRDSLHGPDVGYLLALLNALLDEAKYESWAAISSYHPLEARR